MLGRKYQIARLQSDFYRDCYRKMLRALSVSILIMLFLILIIIYFVLFQHSPSYFATTTSGQIIPLVPVSSGT